MINSVLVILYRVSYIYAGNRVLWLSLIIIHSGKPPALPGDLARFDLCGGLEDV